MFGVSIGSRQYGGVAAEDRVAERRARFLAAGLEVMGTRGIARTTVRGVVEEAGLAARYFYESFAGIEELQVAVFDEIAREAAQRALDAVLDRSDDGRRADGRRADGEEARRSEGTRAVLAEMVDLMLEDPRKGRIAVVESISSPVLGPRVHEESRRFAGMLAATASGGDPNAGSDGLPLELRLTAQFLIGGVAHAFSAALQGEVAVDRERVVDVLTDLFVAVDRGVIRPLGGATMPMRGERGAP
jgi:AcrR family transcriptional regulator